MDQRELLARLSPPSYVTTDELAEGMNLSYSNAASLVADAERLRKMSPGRSLALAILAMEEIGKIFLLYEIAILSAGRPTAGRDVARAVRTHSEKQMVFALYGTHIDSDSFGYEVDVPVGLVEVLDRFKQLGIYVDVTSTGFLSPTVFGADNTDWADWAISAAAERLRSLEGLHSTPDKSREFVRFGLGTLRTVVRAVVESGGIDSLDAEAAVRNSLREVMRKRREKSVAERRPLMEKLRGEGHVIRLRMKTLARRASELFTRALRG